MGKKSTPRRGSLAFLPRARAARIVGRIKFWPEVKTGPKLLGFAGYKAGMISVHVIEDNPHSPNYGKEIVCPATVIDAPSLLVYGIRVYKRGDKGLQTLSEVWMEKLPRDVARVLIPPKKSNLEKGMELITRNLDRIEEVHLLTCTQPKLAGIRKKTPELFEIRIGGGTTQQRFEYAKSLLGKTVRLPDVFKEGQYVDAIAITKGKGIAGPVKRWGISLLTHKARKGRRKPGTLGPWHPAHVLYTVPRMGQLGFHQRTEYRKLILKIGADGKEVTPRGGFLRYGLVKGDYMLLKGSIPGPAKRLIRLRYSVRAEEEPKTKPQIIRIGLGSQQGA